MTYWIYQHLGNLDPQTIRGEGLLAELLASDDGTSVLRAWADRTAECAREEGGYRFSFVRDLGEVRLVMVDTRHDRVLTPGGRRLLQDDDWGWVVEQCHRPATHLLIGSSLPAFTPVGVHDLQVWDEEIADGRWGRRGARLGESIRRGLDLEDWPSFSRSFEALVELLARRGHRCGRTADDQRALRRHPPQLPRSRRAPPRTGRCSAPCTSWSTRRSATRSASTSVGRCASPCRAPARSSAPRSGDPCAAGRACTSGASTGR